MGYERQLMGDDGLNAAEILYETIDEETGERALPAPTGAALKAATIDKVDAKLIDIDEHLAGSSLALGQAVSQKFGEVDDKLDEVDATIAGKVAEVATAIGAAGTATGAATNAAGNADAARIAMEQKEAQLLASAPQAIEARDEAGAHRAAAETARNQAAGFAAETGSAVAIERTARLSRVSDRRRFPDPARLFSFQDERGREFGKVDDAGLFDIKQLQVRIPGWTIREMPRLEVPGGITFLAANGRLLGKLDPAVSVSDVAAALGSLSDTVALQGDNIASLTAQLSGLDLSPKATPFLGAQTLKRSRALIRKRLANQPLQLRIAFHMDSWGATSLLDRWIGYDALRLHDGGLNGATALGWGGFGFIGFAAPSSGAPKGASETNFLTIARSGTWTDNFGTDVNFIDACSAQSMVAGSRHTITSTATVALTSLKLLARGAGSYRYSWDGGTTWTAGTLTGASRQVVDLAGVPATAGWTLLVENTSTTPLILNGLVPGTAASGVVTHRINATGTKMQQRAALDPVNFAANAALIAPDVVLLGTPINDRNAGRTVAQWKADTAAVIDLWRTHNPTIDIVIVCPPEVGGTNTVTPAMALYTAAAIELAQTKRCAVVDFQALVGPNLADYAFENPNLPLLDNVNTHFSGDGRYLYQDTILRLLTTA